MTALISLVGCGLSASYGRQTEGTVKLPTISFTCCPQNPIKGRAWFLTKLQDITLPAGTIERLLLLSWLDRVPSESCWHRVAVATLLWCRFIWTNASLWNRVILSRPGSLLRGSLVMFQGMSVHFLLLLSPLLPESQGESAYQSPPAILGGSFRGCWLQSRHLPLLGICFRISEGLHDPMRETCKHVTSGLLYDYVGVPIYK
jgi:hypothetical protein